MADIPEDFADRVQALLDCPSPSYDDEIESAKTELLGAVHRALAKADASFREQACQELVFAIDSYVDIKIAVAFDMVSDRIEAKTGVRP